MSYIYFSPCYITKYSVYTSTNILKYINYITNHNIVLYLYCPYIILLNILYIQLHILKCINCLLTAILSYIHISLCYITKYSIYTSSDILKYINCIINHNIVLYFYCPYVMLLIILNIQIHCLLTVILSYIHIFSMLYY